MNTKRFLIEQRDAMNQSIQIECPHGDRKDVVKNGRSENGTHRYRWNACRRSFQGEYTYRAWLPDVHHQIVSQTLKGSGSRDIGRHLGISKETVAAALKKKSLPRSTSPTQTI